MFCSISFAQKTSAPSVRLPASIQFIASYRQKRSFMEKLNTYFCSRSPPPPQFGRWSFLKGACLLYLRSASELSR